MTPLEQQAIEEFEKEFVLDSARVFFGDPEELRKQGWEVGKSRLILKQDLEPEILKAFLLKWIRKAREEERKSIINNLALLRDVELKDTTIMKSRAAYNLNVLINSLTAGEEVTHP